MKNQPELSRRLVYLVRIAGAAALALCLGAGVRAQQEQQGQGQDQGQGQQAQSPDQSQQAPPQQQDPNAKPKYASQDADKPPYSNDRTRRSVPPPNSSPNQNAPGPATAPAPPEMAAPQVPPSLVIPKGTVLSIRTNNFLSSDRNQVGDQFTATLDQPIVVNGWVVARRGQTLIGQVKAAQKAGRIKGVSQLGLELTDVTLVDGQQLPILTELWKASAGTSHGQDAATIAGTTGLGAIIGSAADWGRGAAIGAGVGAVAGIGAVLLTRGHPTEIAPETPLNFQLVDPVTVDTTKSLQAFLPVTPQDYDHRVGHRRPRLARAYPYPGPWYGPCPYGPCYYRPY
ncbi:MAG TPA: hypothetical protein VE263_02355 [Candidatus Angelobacter sp.]|nr:hypothetical protein [Candidatus Angelobacter sp.]